MKFAFPFAILMVLHTVFVILGAYSITHLDSVMHLAGGISLGLLVFGMIGHAVSKGWCPDPGRVILPVLIVSLVATGAVCWEIYEWLSDAYLGTHFQPSLDDTVKDLALGLAGGIACAAMVLTSGTHAALPASAGVERRPLKSES